MIQFKLNGKKIQIPSSWDDLSFKQYCEFGKSKLDIIGLIHLFSGIDCEILKKATIIGIDDIIIALSFLNKLPKTPESVEKCGKYPIPKDFNIQFESLAQFEDMRKVMLVSSSDLIKLTESYSTYVAIYLQKIRDGEYDYSKALEMIREVEQMPAMEVLCLGNFFTVKVLTLLNGTSINSRHTNQTRKKSKQATTSSRKSSVTTGRSRKRR